jgi:hypothetical protein
MTDELTPPTSPTDLPPSEDALPSSGDDAPAHAPSQEVGGADQPDDLLADEADDELPLLDDESLLEDFGSAETAPLDIDIDAALAALGSLDDVMSKQAAAEAAERERIEAERRAEEEYRRWAESYRFARPGMARVQAGRPASIVPALGLMALGALLTFGSALDIPPVSAQQTAALALLIAGASLLSYWLTARRWARGALFSGLCALGGGVLVGLPTVSLLALPVSAPWMVLGAALALTGGLSRPTSGTLAAIGGMVLVASVVAVLI